MTSWLQSEPPPDMRAMTLSQLLQIWKSARNSILGLLAADEVCRRLTDGKA